MICLIYIYIYIYIDRYIYLSIYIYIYLYICIQRNMCILIFCLCCYYICSSHGVCWKKLKVSWWLLKHSCSKSPRCKGQAQSEIVFNFSNNWQTRSGRLLSDRGRSGRIAERGKFPAFKEPEHCWWEAFGLVHHTLAALQCLGIIFKDMACLCTPSDKQPTFLRESVTGRPLMELRSFQPFLLPPILRSHFSFLQCGLPQLLIPEHNLKKNPFVRTIKPCVRHSEVLTFLQRKKIITTYRCFCFFPLIGQLEEKHVKAEIHHSGCRPCLCGAAGGGAVWHLFGSGAFGLNANEVET